MAASNPGLMRELEHLIKSKKIEEAIAFLQKNNAVELQSVITGSSILHLLAFQKCDGDALELWSLWEMSMDAEFDSYIQWLPEEVLIDTIELIPTYSLSRLFHLLRKYGADVNAPGRLDQTPLHFAINQGNESMARLLLKYGANINAQDKNGETPLHAAVYWGNISIVRLLLENGADVMVQDKNRRRTPMHLALEIHSRVLHIDSDDNNIIIMSLLNRAKEKAEQKASSSSSNLPVSSNRHSIHSNPRSSNASKSQEKQDPPEKKFSPPGSPR